MKKFDVIFKFKYRSRASYARRLNAECAREMYLFKRISFDTDYICGGKHTIYIPLKADRALLKMSRRM